MIFIKATTSDVIKDILIKGYQEMNEFDEPLEKGTIGFTSVMNNQPALIDFQTKDTVLHDKFDINLLVDSEYDISPFQFVDPTSFQLPELTSEEISEINNNVGSEIITTYQSNLGSIEKYPRETIRKFATFCRLLGFFELSLNDVTLSTNDVSEPTITYDDEGNEIVIENPIDEEKILTITVKSSHPLYKGSVRIKTW